ncbi:hypothetical protein K438DRAFT_1226540 [Mycena galopus ATCC 62051]|nr:hypothetical protein K438DRAFT_1226540 [Mycena galopus ATCC 62051]
MISAAQTQHDVERGHVSDFAAAKERQSLKAKQKAVPASRGGASSSGPSNSRPSPGIQDQLSAIMDRISTISAVQDRQTAELREMQRREVGRAPRGNAPEIQGLVDFVRGMVSALAPQLQPPPASSSNIGFPTRKWSASYRGRSRGRGGSVSFGDHLHRSMPSRDISEYRQARHQQHFGYRNAPFPPPRQHAEQQYGYERVWVPGPHAHAQERERERERERHEEPERYHAYAEDDRREPQERPRKRRFTRFSPPNSPGNGLDLVLVPRSTTRPLPPVRGFEGEDGSEGSGNVNDPSGSIQLFRRQTPATGANASGLADKFFRSLQRPSRSPTPYDDQDWETSYEKNIDKN